jgi:AcrR family transcriptional regulator
MTAPKPSARRDELLERSYRYVLEHGISALSLRPLAADVQSSPRVLLFLFGSKDELVRALIGRARADELRMLDDLRDAGEAGIFEVATEVWTWLAAPAHRAVLTLWLESYARSLIEPDGPWRGFAEATVRDWLDLLAAAQPEAERRTTAAETERSLVLAVLRGALLDLLATGDVERTTAAVMREIDALRIR